MKIKKKLKAKDIIARIVLVSLALSVIYVLIRLINAPASDERIDIKVKSDYMLMLIQCIFGILALSLPYTLHKRASIQLPDSFLIAYFVFLFCAIYLGEVRSFYYVVPHWDTILHTFSGAMLGTLGFSVVMLLNDSEKVVVHLSPFFVALFAFCFALALGSLWEIYEYAMDYVLNSNMQKFLLRDGTELVGRAALDDTLKDLIVDAIGAFATSSVGYIMMRNKPEWLNRFDVKAK